MSPLATCDRLIADAPPVRCEGNLLLRIEASPTPYALAFVVMRCSECGHIQEAAAVSAYDDSSIQAEGGL